MKRGSLVVFFVILFLVILLVAGILVFKVFNNSLKVNSSYVSLEIQPDSIKLDNTQSKINLSVSLSEKSVSPDSIISIISNGSDSYEETISVFILPSNPTNLSFSYGNLDESSLETITLVPVLKGSRGASVLGQISNVYDFKDNKILSVKTGILVKNSKSLTKIIQAGGSIGGSSSGGGSSGGRGGSRGGNTNNLTEEDITKNVSENQTTANETINQNANVTSNESVVTNQTISNETSNQTIVSNNTNETQTNKSNLEHVIITSSKDTALWGDVGNAGYYERGLTPTFDYRHATRVGLYYFDLSSIPKNSIIKNATMELYSIGFNTWDKDGSVPIFLVQTQPPNENIEWVEGGGVTYYSQYGGTSWNAKTNVRIINGGYYERPTYLWSNSKGRFSKGDLASAYYKNKPVGEMNFVKSLGQQNSTDLSKTVQFIINRGYEYEGFAVDMYKMSGARKDIIATREYSDESKTPKLEIVYTLKNENTISGFFTKLFNEVFN